MQPMTITVLPPTTDHELHILVTGELDTATSRQLDIELDAVLARRPAGIQLDLSLVTFFSCTAARTLWGARQRSRDTLTLVGVTRPTRRLLEIMQLQPLITTGKKPSADPANTVTALRTQSLLKAIRESYE